MKVTWATVDHCLKSCLCYIASLVVIVAGYVAWLTFILPDKEKSEAIETAIEAARSSYLNAYFKHGETPLVVKILLLKHEVPEDAFPEVYDLFVSNRLHEEFRDMSTNDVQRYIDAANRMRNPNVEPEVNALALKYDVSPNQMAALVFDLKLWEQSNSAKLARWRE